jgi:hypothetical protein
VLSVKDGSFVEENCILFSTPEVHDVKKELKTESKRIIIHLPVRRMLERTSSELREFVKHLCDDRFLLFLPSLDGFSPPLELQ